MTGHFFKKSFYFFLSLLIVVQLTLFPNGVFLLQKTSKNSFYASAQSNPAPPAFDPYPRAPQRFIAYLRNVEETIEELVALGESLNQELSYANCSYAGSQCIPSVCPKGFVQCIPGSVLGSPYRNPELIKKRKEEIRDKIKALSYQKQLIEKELESKSLDCELKSLRPELAQELRGNINTALERLNAIISQAEEADKIYSQDHAKNCGVTCRQETCGIEACFELGTGAQRNIEIDVNVGVSLSDLDIGTVGIDKFHLGLPESLELSKLGDVAINIPAQTAMVCTPPSPIELSVNAPSFEELPDLSFSCPAFDFLPDLDMPEPPIFNLPEEFNLGFFGSAGGKDWCQQLTSILFDVLEPVGDLQDLISEEISDLEDSLEEIIQGIDQQIENTADEAVKESLLGLRENIIEGVEEAIDELENQTQEASQEFETPSAETPSAEIDISGPEPIQGGSQLSTDFAPPGNFSLNFQCNTPNTDSSMDVGAETKWYFKISAWLMEKCASLPGMTSGLGLTERAADCYNPDRVTQTINQECDSLWAQYCNEYPPQTSLPKICRQIRYSCELNNKKLAAALQCQELFTEEKEPIPSGCTFQIIRDFMREPQVIYPPDFDPLGAISKKCQELKEKERKDPPEACSLLPVFTNEQPLPSETFSPYGSSSCPAQRLLQLPFGFGGGVDLNCAVGITSPPKIRLPDISIPDLILPEFRIPPFLEIKLPNFYFEDLRLPDIDLCSLDECASLFPFLSFNALNLKLPSLGGSAPIPNLNASVGGGVDFPSISLPLPSLNLFNFLAPEISIPQIPLPQPVISFAVSGIDTSAIFDLIFTFILNALDVPDFGGCLILRIPSVFLSIVYPDYYFSFKQIPEIPEIPYCKDINGFCKDLKNSLGNNGWLNKAREVERIVNEKISQVQEKIDESITAVEGELQVQLNNIFGEYGDIIYNQIQKKLDEAGLSIQDYINSQTGILDLDQVPFPGVIPVEPDQEIQGSGEEKVKKCLPVPLPERNIILRFVSPEEFQRRTRKVEREGNNVIIYTPLDIPDKIPIPWPDDLKEIPLNHPIGYDVPPIPLSKLSYYKTIPIKGPGFQPRSFLFSFGPSSGECVSGSATGGNPVPLSQLESLLDRLKDLQTSFDSTSQTIKNILE